jgi:hypothetical protein
MSAPCFDIFVLLNAEPGARAERDFPHAVRQRAFPSWANARYRLPIGETRASDIHSLYVRAFSISVT